MENKKYSKIATLEMLMNADPALIKKFLFNKIKSDDALGQELYAFLDDSSPKKNDSHKFEELVAQDIKDIKEALNKPLRGSSSPVYKSPSPIDKLVTKSLKRISNQAPTTALRVRCQLNIITLIAKSDISLYDEAYDKMIDSILEDFKKIYNKDDRSEDKVLFEECLKFLNHKELFRLGAENVEHFILKHYIDIFPQKIKNYVKGRIKDLSSKGYQDWRIKFELGEYVCVILNIMRKQGATETELCDFAKDFWDIHNVRMWVIQFFKQNQQWDEAIGLVQQSLISDKDAPSFISELKSELKELYLISGQRENYKETLLSIIKESKNTRIEEFHELKSLLPTELWEKQLESILEWKKDDKSVVAEYLFKEDLMDRLAELVLGPDTDFSLLEDYVLVLPEEYDQRIWAAYQRHFNQLASKATSPTDFYWLLESLPAAFKIENGEDLICKLLSQWLLEFKDNSLFCEQITLFKSKFNLM